MKYKYILENNGQATNIQRVKDSYQIKEGESFIQAEIPPTSEELSTEEYCKNNGFKELRLERNRRLRDSDFSQLSDSPLTTEDKTAWKTYRQALRDLPQNIEDPLTVAWPVAPE